MIAYRIILDLKRLTHRFGQAFRYNITKKSRNYAWAKLKKEVQPYRWKCKANVTIQIVLFELINKQKLMWCCRSKETMILRRFVRRLVLRMSGSPEIFIDKLDNMSESAQWILSLGLSKLRCYFHVVEIWIARKPGFRIRTLEISATIRENLGIILQRCSFAACWKFTSWGSTDRYSENDSFFQPPHTSAVLLL